ncbi:hypothetical protein ACFL0D_05785 [Thermoproteota archaeon]
MDVNTVIIQTNCVHCGSQIKVEAQVYKGKDLFNEEMLKKDNIYPNDPYAFVHLLCEKCDIMRGMDEDAALAKVKKKNKSLLL